METKIVQGLFSSIGTVVKDSPKNKEAQYNCAWEDTLIDILTNENSKSFFTSAVGNTGKLEVTNESVKSFVLDKLYSIVTNKISKMDVDYQEILKTNGEYTKYKHFKSIDETVKLLVDLIKNASEKLDVASVRQLNEIFECHSNIIASEKDFKDAFKFNVGVVKQYYFTVVSSIIYATGFIVTSMIDYEQRNGNVNYDIVFKGQNIMERGLPKNMLEIIRQFNEDVKAKVITKTVAIQKTKKVTKESAVSLEFAPIAVVGAVTVGLLALPALIRYAIYFFMHSKIKLAEYFEAQAAFLELNIRKIQGSNMSQSEKEKIIKRQQVYLEKLQNLAVKISSDRYTAEKEATKEIEAEDKQVVKEADAEAKNDEQQLANSDILL